MNASHTNSIQCPARQEIARIVREARLAWRLSRIRETLDRLEPIIGLVERQVDVSPARRSGACGANRRFWARGAVRLAASCAYLINRPATLDAMVALARSQWGDDATLLQLAARQAMDDGRVEESVATIRQARELKPRRPRLLELLGRLEAQAGNMDEALAAVRVAARLRPRHARLRIELAELALASCDYQLGLAALGALIDPPCLLHARLLAGCGQLRESIEMYTRVIDGRLPSPATQSVSPNHATTLNLRRSGRGGLVDQDLLDAAVERIDVLERMGDRAGLLALAETELADPFKSKAILVRLADAALNMGDALLCVRLARHARHGIEAPYALALLSVSATLLGRTILAERCRGRLTKKDQSLLARAWRRGMMTEIIAAQTSCERAGADPTQSVLEPLLRHATRVLDDELAQGPQYADLHFHRGNCLAALGRTDEATSAVGSALRINPNYTEAQRLADHLRLAA